MKIRRISIKTLLVVSILLLVFTNAVTYVLLMKKYIEWKEELAEINFNTSVVAEALTEHMFYDGDSIPGDQIIRHYSRSGKILGSNNLSNELQGDKVVMLLTQNCCTSCAKEEIEKLLELSKKIGRDNLVIVADFALHSGGLWSENFDKDGYYETEVENMGLKDTTTQESVVVMLTQNGRVKTSFIVQPLTKSYVDKFHVFLQKGENRFPA